jgi:hypothetical protein
VSLRRFWCVAFARQATLAFALSGVAERFVEGAVRSFGRVCEDAVDDELGFRQEGVVGAVAFTR